jgi:serine protease Do
MRFTAKQYLPPLVIVATLGIGILIGTLISRGVRAVHPASLASGATLIPPPSPAQLSKSFAEVVRHVEPAVVNINTVSAVKPQGGHSDDSPFGGLFDHFFRFGDPGIPRQGFAQRSLGSGVILDGKGYILTNDHVITQSIQDKPVDRIVVFLYGDQDTKYWATIVGADKATDLAVIKIDAGKSLPHATLGDSNSVQVGDWVLAIGSPFGLEATVTAGIISAKDRPIEPGVNGQFKRFLQTDAAINPGNSGGPLVNLAGQVIGINTAIATNGGSNDGVGFAIPSGTVRKVYNEIVTRGEVQRGAIGIMFREQQPSALLQSFGADHGVVVNSVEPGGPADRAGLRMGDVIQSINGEAIQTPDQLVQIVANSDVGTKLRLGYLRSGKRDSAVVEVGDRNKIIAASESPRQLTKQQNSRQEDEGALGVFVRAPSSGEERLVQESLHLKESQGVVVESVDPDGVAADMSVDRGDVILAIDHKAIRSMEDFRLLQGTLKSGSNVLLLVARRTGQSYATLFLADRLP